MININDFIECWNLASSSDIIIMDILNDNFSLEQTKKYLAEYCQIIKEN